MLSILHFLREKNTYHGSFRADYAIMIGGVVLGVAIIVLAVVLGGGHTAPALTSVDTPTDGRTGLELGTAPVRGHVDAPHTIIEFFDFQCVACGAYFTQIEPQIMQKFIDTGKAKLVVKPLHFIDDYVSGGLGKESLRATTASLCAQTEGKFWDFYDALFTAEQDEVRAGKQNENSGNLTEDFMIQRAQEFGMDTSSFTRCLNSDTYTATLKSYLQDAMAALQGQISTPSVFIDGKRLQNPFDMKEYETLIP